MFNVKSRTWRLDDEGYIVQMWVVAIGSHLWTDGMLPLVLAFPSSFSCLIQIYVELDDCLSVPFVP